MRCVSSAPRYEFTVAMHLVYRALQGDMIPDQVGGPSVSDLHSSSEEDGFSLTFKFGFGSKGFKN